MQIEPPANPLTGVGAGKATTDRTTTGTVNADASAAPAASAARAANVGGGASVSTSALSSEMRALQEALAQTGMADIDVAKVAAIKTAIANGQLAIDTSRIADGLIATARDLLSAQSKS
ncbi:flagellar biosynthesis anti-sigma factor FlgM [Pandoraea faecigallinarum]|uniref:Negative regulator of flagellin synthesis n=1 Tax=Pandoraea faecigallinarum TaxID=656179 RepID=A0A0H3WSB5_9BURK|nr:flagellar biosynthesis anti-sigma factor FlgM [Pandoraea faecigallinarum]AKM30510.1 flagellar biosynthesis anti-sigma factor FlgM [Pandoraea faecigallinarum]